MTERSVVPSIFRPTDIDRISRGLRFLGGFRFLPAESSFSTGYSFSRGLRFVERLRFRGVFGLRSSLSRHPETSRERL